MICHQEEKNLLKSLWIKYVNTLEHLNANRIVQKAKAAKDEKYWAKYYKRKLQNLLAVVRRDGGQYTAEHGIEKSTEDALQIIADAVVE